MFCIKILYVQTLLTILPLPLILLFNLLPRVHLVLYVVVRGAANVHEIVRKACFNNKTYRKGAGINYYFFVQILPTVFNMPFRYPFLKNFYHFISNRSITISIGQSFNDGPQKNVPTLSRFPWHGI